MKKKLVLKSLQVKSFVTNLNEFNKGTIKGGNSLDSADGTCDSVQSCESVHACASDHCMGSIAPCITTRSANRLCPGGDTTINRGPTPTDPYNSLNAGCTDIC